MRSQRFPPNCSRAWPTWGWFSLPFAEADGGDGGGPVELILIAEELGRASFDVAMCYTGVLIPGITVFNWGSAAQRAFIREQVMTGRQRLAVAVSEPDSGSDAAALRTLAQDRGDHFLVNGQKMWCTGAGLPDTTIATYVRTGPREPEHEGISLLLIDPQAEGVEVRRTPTLARHVLGTNEVYLSDVVVPRENLVGPQDQGWSVLLSTIELGKVIITGGYLGAAQATLDEMLAFAKTRHAFGRHQPDPAQRHRPQHGPANLLRGPRSAGCPPASPGCLERRGDVPQRQVRLHIAAGPLSPGQRAACTGPG